MIWVSMALLAVTSFFPVIQSGSTIRLELGDTTITEDGSRVIQFGGRCGSGGLLAFHLPQKGWFVVSTEPFPGYDFQRIAKLDGNKIRFSLNSKQYEITSDHPISSTEQKLDLWVVQITPPADKADAQSKSISCASDLQIWLKTRLLRDIKN
ncbi:MAG TPA: hypothetical protein VGQ41_15825 [Pyrinomonadaceae bacterium]|nr:hypothetical protein [Pyrinomonadaceae bacterium]